MTKRNKKSARRVRVGVDTGGTFTDFVFEAAEGLRLFKRASTPSDPSLAIIEGLKRISAETGAPLDEIEVIHGTTVGTNALLERRGARTALVTTKGFEDAQEAPARVLVDEVRERPARVHADAHAARLFPRWSHSELD